MRSRRSRRSDLPFRRRVGSMFSHHSPYSGGQCTDRQRRQSLSATSLGGQVVRPSNAGRFRYCLAAESSIWRAANAATLLPIGIGGCLPDLTWPVSWVSRLCGEAGATRLCVVPVVTKATTQVFEQSTTCGSCPLVSGSHAHSAASASRGEFVKIRRALMAVAGGASGPADHRTSGWMHGLGLHKLLGTIRYPKAA